MTKFLPQKKKLLEDVYEKASTETTDTSFSGILLYLEQVLKDEYEGLSYKSFENYYKSIVEREEDYNIKRPILDNLSQYLGYDTFKDYCSEWKTIEYAIQHTISKIVITIINKPILTMPDFFKKNGLGIVEMTFILLIVTGGVVFSGEKKIKSESIRPIGIWGNQKLDTDKKYMYWSGERYIATDSNYIRPGLKVIAMNKDVFLYLKKITMPDTITIDNSKGRVWYDKSDNVVEYFTSPGIHPENGKALKDITETIIDNHVINKEKSED